MAKNTEGQFSQKSPQRMILSYYRKYIQQHSKAQSRMKLMNLKYKNIDNYKDFHRILHSKIKFNSQVGPR